MKHSGAHNALEQTMHLVFLLFGVVTIGFVPVSYTHLTLRR